MELLTVISVTIWWFCSRKFTHDVIGNHTTSTDRSLKHYSNESILQSLLGSEWDTVYYCEHVSEDRNNSKSNFISSVNNIAPVKSVCIKQRIEPWVASEILQCIKDRDNDFYDYKKQNSRKFKYV